MAALHASDSTTNMPAYCVGSCSPENGSPMVRSKRICFQSAFEASDDTCEEAEGSEDFVHQPEKKKRMTVEQVKSLEKNFELENKLEPERKIQIANELGLQPRQVAVWFQNRRARWKTKKLERDYDALKIDYCSLQEKYDALMKAKEIVESEMMSLKGRLQLIDSQNDQRRDDSQTNFTGNSTSDTPEIGKESHQGKQQADTSIQDLPVPLPTIAKEGTLISDTKETEVSNTSSSRCLQSKVSKIVRETAVPTTSCILMSSLKSDPQATSFPMLFSESLLKKVQAAAIKFEPESMDHETAGRNIFVETDKDVDLQLWDWDYCNFCLNI